MGSGNFRPSPDRGLLFPAGETRKEITFTLPEEAGDPGKEKRGDHAWASSPRSASAARTAQAPTPPTWTAKLSSGVPDEGAVHIVTVSDSDPESREPYCFSLWGGARCRTAAVLPHAVAGPAGRRASPGRNSLSPTGTPGRGGARRRCCSAGEPARPGRCRLTAASPRETFSAPPVPRGRGRDPRPWKPLRGEASRTGAVYVFTRSPCRDSSLKVAGAHPAARTRRAKRWRSWHRCSASRLGDWLGDGDCRVLTGVFGDGTRCGCWPR